MRILAFSDLHGDELALEALGRLTPSYDHIFICGDISHSASYAESVLESFPKAFIVPGNWDSKIVNEKLAGSPGWVHEKRVPIEDGLNVVGFGYSPPTPFGTFGELGEGEIYARMSRLDIDQNTLLLLHCPPKGHFDQAYLRSIGSNSILKIIEEKKPLAAFFGHAHEHFGAKKLGTTELIKLPPANSMRACSVSIINKKISAEFLSL